jgi:hypothetical protein
MKPSAKPLKGLTVSSNFGTFETLNVANLQIEAVNIAGLFEDGIFQSVLIKDSEIVNTVIGVAGPNIGYFTDLRTSQTVNFMSDQFNFCEEAGGQYNCSPFFTPKAPPIKPNPSFDLTRLATALFWDIYPEGPKYSEYQNYPVFKLFMKWMTLDEGSVLFFKNNPKIDRFIGFSLYKAIAKYSKNAIPQKEIQELSCFLGECPLDETPLIIED